MYFTEKIYETSEVEAEYPIAVWNLRKQTGHMAELLVEYNNLEREWSYINGPLKEIPNLVEDYLNKNNFQLDSLNGKRVGVKTMVKLAFPEKKQQWKEESESSEDEEDFICELNHSKLTNFHEEEKPGYCAPNFQYYNGTCKGCNKQFVNSIPKDMSNEEKKTLQTGNQKSIIFLQ